MSLEEILKSQGLTDEQIQKVVGEMKQNKIFTAGEENLDIRYSKLKEKYNALANKPTGDDDTSNTTVANKDLAELQKKVKEYEATVNAQTQALAEAKKESAIKMALVSSKAKTTDIDYLLFKLKKANSEVKLDDNGNIENVKEIMDNLKTQYPNQFETTTAGKSVDEFKLGEGNHDQTLTKNSILKMPYAERAKLYAENKEAYETAMHENK